MELLNFKIFSSVFLVGCEGRWDALCQPRLRGQRHRFVYFRLQTKRQVDGRFVALLQHRDHHHPWLRLLHANAPAAVYVLTDEAAMILFYQIIADFDERF